MTEQSPDHKEHLLQQFYQTCEAISLNIITTYCPVKEYTLAAAQSKRSEYNQCMVAVAISGELLETLFKFHFSLAVSKEIAANFFGRARHNIVEEESIDVVKEVCNVTCGHIAAALEANGVKVGYSLPLVSHGFADIFIKRSFFTHYYHRFGIRFQDGTIECSIQTKIKDEKVLEKLEHFKNINIDRFSFLS